MRNAAPGYACGSARNDIRCPHSSILSQNPEYGGLHSPATTRPPCIPYLRELAGSRSHEPPCSSWGTQRTRRPTDVGDAEFVIADPDSPFLIVFTPVRIVGEPACREHIAFRWGRRASLRTCRWRPVISATLSIDVRESRGSASGRSRCDGQEEFSPAAAGSSGAAAPVEPDLFVIPFVPGVLPRAWEDVGRLLLTVEVLSPPTLRTDRGDKRDLYQRKGVPEYCIVDVDGRRVERWRPNDTASETLTSTLERQPDRFTEPLTIDLPQYFARVVGESK